MTADKYPQFQKELLETLAENELGTFFFATMVQDKDGDLSDLPVIANVMGDPAHNLSPARISAVLVEHCIRAHIQMLMRQNGLTLHQAVGAVQESVKAAAYELGQAQQAFLQQAAGRRAGARAEG